MADEIFVRIGRSRVIEYGDYCMVSLGPPDELLRLVMEAVANPGKAAVLRGAIQGVVMMGGGS